MTTLPPDDPLPAPVVAAAPGTTTQAPLVSVVVPCCGQLEYTRLLVPSLRRHCRRPVELIFLDIGSLDGTSEFLDGVAAAATVPVEVLHYPYDRSFQEACQAGLQKARGEYVVWLNNDTIVTSGWLNHLVALASAHPSIGLVGPMANYAPKAQQVPQVPYRLRLPRGQNTDGQHAQTIEPLEQFAQQWRQEHKGQWQETNRLGGFCLFLKRELLSKLTWFDEKAEPGTFDADFVCWKVRQAGYRIVVCGDLYIHHFGSRLAVREP